MVNNNITEKCINKCMPNETPDWRTSLQDGKITYIKPSGYNKVEEGLVVGCTLDRKHYYILLSCDMNVVKIPRDEIKF